MDGTKLYTAPPSVEALQKEVAELKEQLEFTKQQVICEMENTEHFKQLTQAQAAKVPDEHVGVVGLDHRILYNPRWEDLAPHTKLYAKPQRSASERLFSAVKKVIDDRLTTYKTKGGHYVSLEINGELAWILPCDLWLELEAAYESSAAPAPLTVAQGLPVSQEPKYTTDGNHIINRASGEPIPHDEPIFIFRARDRYAVHALDAYLNRLPINPDPTQNTHWHAVRHRTKDFDDFAEAHPERMKQPDTAPPQSETDKERKHV
jgi:hypothetical protein